VKKNAWIAVFASVPARLMRFQPSKSGEFMGGFGKGLTLAFFLLLFISFFSFAEEVSFPQITNLNHQNDRFKQFISDVQANRMRIMSLRNGIDNENVQSLADSLTIFLYIPKENEDLFFLAMRTNIPSSTIASLNRITHPTLVEAGKPILLPTMPGIFILDKPESGLEQLLANSHMSSGESVQITINRAQGISGGVYHFYPGRDFNDTERTFFLNAGFRYPLRSFFVTSSFGMRRHPITGRSDMHPGIDLAAPTGTDVYATAAGKVTDVGYHQSYGNFIVLTHANGWTSLYAHLSEILVVKDANVRSGSVIGKVGSTGNSTGPHLHFELKQHGVARDPDIYLFMPGRR